jgi:type IV pilus assembly protein PilO
MSKLDEMSVAAKTGVLFLVALLAGGLYYYGFLSKSIEENKQIQAQVKAKQDENDRLRPYQDKLNDLNADLIHLQQQLDREKLIVPDEKEADKFIKLLHDTAAAAGIEVRRFTAMPIGNKGYVTEVPFQIDLDGPYYSVVNFFDRVAKLDRIINITNLQMTNTKATGPAKVKTTYSYAAGESVVASCTATTFFSHDLQPQDVAPIKK